MISSPSIRAYQPTLEQLVLSNQDTQTNQLTSLKSSKKFKERTKNQSSVKEAAVVPSLLMTMHKFLGHLKSNMNLSLKI